MIGLSTDALPWVAPPPPEGPFLLFPCPNVERSLFFNHRSGSGAGVTPGMTPAGTRDIRTFLGAGLEFKALDVFTVVESEACCTATEGSCGGGAVSRVEVIDVGSESKA